MLFIVPPLVYFFIPESPRLYMMRGQFGLAAREANKIILRSGARIAPLSVDAEASSSPLPARLPPYSAVFGPNQIRATLVATLTWLSALVSYYLFSFMLPKALVDQGYAVQLSFGLSTLLFLVAIPGRILNAYMMERLGRRLTIFVALSSSVVGLFLMVIAHSLAGTTFGVAAPTLTFTIGVVIAGLTVLSCFPAVRMYMTEQFPTNIRGRGYFLSEMTGRAVAGIAIPYLMAGHTASPTIFFGTVLVFAIVGAVVPVLFGRETRGQLELVTATDRCSVAAEAAIRSDATASSSGGWSKSRTCG
jgi:MFS transporter, putative metabolite:H+ symporter